MHANIENVQSKITVKKEDLDQQRAKFIEACKTNIKQEINNYVRNAISSNPQKAKELGEEGLAPIKIELNKSLQTTENVVEKALLQKELWLHHQDILTTKICPYGHYSVHGNSLPKSIEKQLRKLLSPAGTIILKYELGDKDLWEEKGQYVHYKYGISFAEDQKETMSVFGDLFNELFYLLEELESLKAKKESTEALNLWDKI